MPQDNEFLKDLVVVSQSHLSPEAGTWLVEDLLKPRGIAILSSVEGVGKSWVRAELSIRLALGTGPLFGKYAIDKPRKVLVLNEDNDPDTEHEREDLILDAIGVTRASLGEMLYRGSFLGTHITDPEERVRLEARIEAVGPALVIIDTGGQTVASEHDEAFKQSIAWVRGIAQKYGCAFVFVVHQVKPREGNGSSSPDITEVMGWWGRWADGVWQLARIKDDKGQPTDRFSWNVSKRMGTSGYVLKQDNDLWVVVSTLHEAQGVVLRQNDRHILTTILGQARKVEGVGGIVDVLEDDGVTITARTVFRRLRDMAEKGLVVEEGEGLWRATDSGRTASGEPIHLHVDRD